MKTILHVAVGILLLSAAAVAQTRNSDSQVRVDDNLYGVTPANKLFVTPDGGSRTTLGAALAAGGGGCTTNCTFGGTTHTSGLADSSGITSTGANAFQVDSAPFAATGTGGPNFIPTWTNVDYSGTITNPGPNGGAHDSRQFMAYTTLSPSLNTTNIWENMNSFLHFNGPGIAQGEINVIHAYFENETGQTVVNAEDYEASMGNYGTISGSYTDALLIAHNFSTGTIGSLAGVKFGLTNDNTTAGSITEYDAILNVPMQGSGSAPTFNYFIKNTDTTAAIVTAGNVLVGGIGIPQASRAFQVTGLDSTSSNFALWLSNSSGQGLLRVDNSGQIFVDRGNLYLGTSGSIVGQLNFYNATSGRVQLVPPTGALGSPWVVTLPSATTTLAGLSATQTWLGTNTVGAGAAWNIGAGSFSIALTTPASSSAPCTTGQFTQDANFLYTCTATNTWKRAALTTF